MKKQFACASLFKICYHKKGDEIMIDYITNITKSKSLKEVKENAQTFLKFVRNNKKDKEMICYQLTCILRAFWDENLKKYTDNEIKTTFIPPEVAPVFMLLTVVPELGSADEIIRGVKAFINRCSEFSEPLSERISETEMKAVLKRAQKLGILDVITQRKPLKIISLANTHYIHNSECGLTEQADAPSEAVLFVYHPREIDPCDRVFIFAHELGHAVHSSITGDVEIIPAGFEAFNKSLGLQDAFDDDLIKEAFADVVAFSLITSEELKEHLPCSEDLSDNDFTNLTKFETYIKQVVKYYNKA